MAGFAVPRLGTEYHLVEYMERAVDVPSIAVVVLARIDRSHRHRHKEIAPGVIERWVNPGCLGLIRVGGGF